MLSINLAMHKCTNESNILMGTHLLLVRLRDHITRHIPDTLINNLRHRTHNALRLRSVQSFALEPLHEVVRVEMKVVYPPGDMEVSSWQYGCGRGRSYDVCLAMRCMEGV